MEKAEKERNEKLSFRFVPTRREIENSKKIAKKLKKLKNTIMASFQAKIYWGRPRKRENKNYHSVQTHNIKFQNNSRTIQKIKKIPLFQAIIGWKRLRKRENKNYHFASFQPDAK